MGLWRDRVQLAARGWNTDLRVEVERKGSCRIGLWAKSWFWRGQVAEVSIHAHDVSPPGDDAIGLQARLDKLSSRVCEAIDRAAIEIGDAVPCVTGVLPDGRIQLGRHALETRGIARGSQVDPPVQAIRFSTDGPESGAYRSALADIIASRTFDWRDALNNHAEPRVIRDPAPREWQFVCQPQLRWIDGARVRAAHYRHTEFSTRLVDESVAARLTGMAAAALRDLLADHAPHGLRHDPDLDGLPPGFSRVENLSFTPAPDTDQPPGSGPHP